MSARWSGLLVALVLGAAGVLAEPMTTRVLPGDTLWKIAARELGDGSRWQAIASLNAIPSPYVIEVGRELRLPDRFAAVAPVAGADDAAASAMAATAGGAVAVAALSPSAQPQLDHADRVALGEEVVSAPPLLPLWPDHLRPDAPLSAHPPLSLEAAIALGLARAPEIRMAAANLERTQALIGVARASALPQVNASGAWRRHETIRSVFPPAVDEHYWTGTVTVNQPLFTFGRLSLAIAAAGVEEAAALAQAAEAQSAVRFGVESAWLNLLLASRRREVAREAVTVANELVVRARAREDAGVGTRFDVTRAEAEEAASLARAVAAQAEADAARERLATALGLPASVAPEVMGSLGTGDLPVPPARAESTCLQERPELALYAHRLRGSEILERYERAQSLPSIDAVASGSWTAHDYITSLPPTYGTEQSSVFGGVGVTVPIFDGFRAREAAARQAATTRELAARAERARLDALREVRAIYYDLGSAREALAARRAGARSSAEALRMARVAFEAGRATALDVIQASLAVSEADRAEAEAAWSYRLGLARLVRACGSVDVIVRSGEGP